MFFIKKKIKYIYFYYYFCGIRVWKTIRNSNPFYFLNQSFKNNSHFNCRIYDKKIKKIVDKMFRFYRFNSAEKLSKKNIVFLATELYDTGGHTEWMRATENLIKDDYKLSTIITKYNQSLTLCSNKIKDFASYSEVFGINTDSYYSFDDGCEFYNKKVKSDLEILYNKIIEIAPRVIFSFIHPDDFISCSLLYLLKKHTKIRIIFVNHASHFPFLGYSFADVCAEALQIPQYVDIKYRGVKRCVKLNLVDQFEKDIKPCSNEIISSVRKEYEIPDNSLFSLSGASSYKFFKGNSSPYFEMIKVLLEKEPSLHHVFMSNLNNDQFQIVKKVFQDSSCFNRLHLVPLRKDYSKVFQACDLFIDSLPIGSALTHIELMKYRKVSVVYINSENSILSFHEYFPSDYRFKSDKTSELIEFASVLLNDANLRKTTGEYLYNHFLNNYEGSYVKHQCIDIIEDSENNFNNVIYTLDPNIRFNLEIEK